MGVRIRQPLSLEVTLRLYYERTELSNKDIIALFGKLSSRTISKYKAAARQIMIKKNVPTFNPLCVNTRAAYEAWGLDIDDLEKRHNKLIKLKLIKNKEE